MLSFLKFVSIAVAGLIGAIAVFSNLRGPDGTLTLWGKLSIIGIAVSTVVGAAIQTFELEIGRLNTITGLERTEKLLFQINRNIQPIEKVEITFWLNFPINHPKLRNYREKLNAAVIKFMDE